MTSIIGQLLNGRYSIVRELKNQSSQITYLAEDSHHSPPLPCIIKQSSLNRNSAIDSCLLDSSWRSSLFKKISKNSQFEDRSCIAKILDYFFWGQDFFIVREYINGESLAEIIKQRQLGELELIHILQQILKVLTVIHKSQAKHLNLKPNNIIFAKSKSKIVLTDLSLNRDLLLVNSANSQLEERKTGEIDYYLAPEQKQGEEEFSSDFYALGAIAIEALTGKSPDKIEFQDRDSYSRSFLIARVTSEQYSISSQFAKVLKKSLQVNPKLRYQSVNEILPLLEQPENILLLGNKNSSSPTDLGLSTEEEPDNYVFGKIKPQAWLLILVSSLTCSLLLLLGYFISWMFKYDLLQRDPLQKVNFLEYQNKNYNIAFEYPSEWTIKELEDPITGEVIVLTAPLESKNDPFQEQLYISIEQINDPQIDYETLLIDKIIGSPDISNIHYQQASTKLANKVAHTMKYQRKQDNLQLQQQEVFTSIGDKVYLLTYIAEKEKYSQFFSTVNRTIESFRVND